MVLVPHYASSFCVRLTTITGIAKLAPRQQIIGAIATCRVTEFNAASYESAPRLSLAWQRLMTKRRENIRMRCLFSIPRASIPRLPWPRWASYFGRSFNLAQTLSASAEHKRVRPSLSSAEAVREG